MASRSRVRLSEFAKLPRLLALAACAFIAAAMLGCPNKTDDSLLVMVDPGEAMEAMDSKRGVFSFGTKTAVWVDPRSLEAYRKAHIPGAVHLPFANVAVDHEHVLEDVDVIVVYGDDYNDVKAKGMSKRLIELGYSDVRTLNGGLRQWESQGHPVETGDPPTLAATP